MRRQKKKDREKKNSPPKLTRNGLAALGLSLLAVIPYLNALHNSFVYDDRLQVLENPYAHSFRYLGKIFGSTSWTFEGAQGVTNYYRPLQTLAYLIAYKLFGPNPFGLHLVSLLLHLGVVLLLFAVTAALFHDFSLSCISAGLFALHPIHTESVVWIADLADLQLCFFFLLTFLFYVRVTLQGDRRGWAWRTAVLASYLCALLSKEQALVLPLLAVAYEHFYRPGRESTSLRDKIARYAPLCLMAMAYLGFRRFVLGAFAPSVSRPDLVWSQVLLSAVALVGGYLGKLIWPAHLSVFYVFHPSRHWSDPPVLAGFAGLLACLFLFVWLWRRNHMVSFALLWMGTTLAPVLNARWMPGAVFAERYLYLPSVGFCWLVGWAMTKIWESSPSNDSATSYPFRRLAVLVALGILCICYGAAVIRRNRDWRTEEVLYRRTLAEQPDAQLIRTNLGLIYWNNGDAIGAEREWVQAMGPEHPYVPTLDNLGMLRTVQERYPEAIDLFQRAIRDSPLYAQAHKNLAAAYADTGKLADADREFRIAVALAPLNAGARNAYGHFLSDQGRDAEAEQQFRASIAADENSDAEESLGEILSRDGEAQQARTAFAAALALDSSDSGAHFGLAAIFERQGRIAEAISEYRAALNGDPQNAAALEALRRLSAAPDQAPKNGTP